MKLPTVSVVLPAYNAASFIQSTLESVFNQTYQDYELIVVDDGSIDTTAEILRSYGDRIRYFWKENGGQSSSRNAGIKLARGQYIAFIDHDDLWLENKLALQLKEMAFGANVGMVTTGCICFKGETDLSTMIPLVNSKSRDALINQLLLSNVLGSCSTALVRAQCFQEVGLFDESLRMAEDWDMWLRLARRYDIRSVERPLVRYRLHKHNFSSSSGEVNLTNELVFLRRVFAEPCFRKRRIVRQKAFSGRYLRAALTLRENHEDKGISRCMLRSFLCYPVIIFDRIFLGLFISCLKTFLKKLRMNVM